MPHAREMACPGAVGRKCLTRGLGRLSLSGMLNMGGR